MTTDTWCVYRTSHPSGFFYIGKSSLRRISSGYVGSGRRLHCAFLHHEFKPETWKTEVLETFTSEDCAYLKEAQLVPLDALANPFCLNDTPGGRGSFRGSPYTLLLKRNKTRKKVGSRVTTLPFWEK